MPLPLYQSVTTASCTVGNPERVILSVPSGLAVGDFMMAGIISSAQSGYGGTNAPDATWLAGISSSAGNGTSSSISIWYKIATSDDVAASTFTFNYSVNTNAQAGAGFLARFTGVDPINPFGATNIGNAANTNSVSISGITANRQTLLILLGGSVHASSNGSGGFNSYAIANNNPTWNTIVNQGDSHGGSGFDHGLISFAWGNWAGLGATGTASGDGGISGSVTNVTTYLGIMALQEPVDYISVGEDLTSSESINTNGISFINVNDALTKTESTAAQRFERTISVSDSKTITESLSVIDSDPKMGLIIDPLTIIEHIEPARFRITPSPAPWGYMSGGSLT